MFICGIGDRRYSSPDVNACKREFDSLEELMEHIYSVHIKVVKVYGNQSCGGIR
jgi:hypothetical protein